MQIFCDKSADTRQLLKEGGFTRYASKTSQHSKVGHLASIFNAVDAFLARKR
jgi:hypothetical protein